MENNLTKGKKRPPVFPFALPPENSNQLGRRNLTDDQRAMIADEAAEFESKLVRSEQAKKARAGQPSDVEATASTTSKPRTRAKAAKAAKVSERKLKRFNEGGKEAPSCPATAA